MTLTGEQKRQIIARRAEERKLVKQEVQVGSPRAADSRGGIAVDSGLFAGIDNAQALGGFPVCAKHCGLTRSFHKPEHIGKRSSRGILYDGHAFETR